MTAAITTFHPPLARPGYRLFDGPLRDVTDVNADQVGVVDMPSDWTCSSRLGTRLGPEALRKAATLLQSIRPQGASVDPGTHRHTVPATNCGDAEVTPQDNDAMDVGYLPGTGSIVHSGAGEQAVSLCRLALFVVDEGDTPDAAAERALEHWTTSHGTYMPGFGHRFHARDPRAPRFMELVKIAQDSRMVSGRPRGIALRVKELLFNIESRAISMNTDGATVVIYAELGFDAALARGLFCLSRSVGILAHAWEQIQQGGCNKGSLPKEYLWTDLKPDEK